MGIIVHSVIIGISMGTSENPKIIKSLIAAMAFHQMFEGMGLGSCISQVYFDYIYVHCTIHKLSCISHVLFCVMKFSYFLSAHGFRFFYLLI